MYVITKPRKAQYSCFADERVRDAKKYMCGRTESITPRACTSCQDSSKGEESINDRFTYPLHLLTLLPLGHLNALANSGKFDSVPMTRYFAGEWGSVRTCWTAAAVFIFRAQIRP